jgi:hypothetical protein
VNIFRFRDRVGVLDERSQRFLKTVAWLGGYVHLGVALKRRSQAIQVPRDSLQRANGRVFAGWALGCLRLERLWEG